MNPIGDVLELVFPHHCVGCAGDVSESEAPLCLECRHSLPILLSDQSPDNEILKEKFSGLLHVSHAIAFLQFVKGGLTQRLLHGLKYGKVPEIGNVLGQILAGELKKRDLAREWDLILPIPLHTQKLQLRGYNQAMRFAEGIADGLKIEVSDDLLIRTTATQTQTKKGRLERFFNVSEVFAVAPNKEELLTGKRILLVDDVVTTGSTMEACGKILHGYPIGSLSIAAISIA